MKCSSITGSNSYKSYVKFQVYSRLKLTQRCSSSAGLVSNLNLLKFMSWNKQPHYLLRAFPWMCTQSPLQGSKGGAVVRSLASHQCGPGSTPGAIDAICGLSLLLVLSLASRGFSPSALVFPSSQKLTLSNSNSIWNARTRLNKFTWTPLCFVGKQQFFFNFIFSILGNEKISWTRPP